MALYSSVVAMKGFNGSRKLFYAEIITVKLKTGLIKCIATHLPTHFYK